MTRTAEAGRSQVAQFFSDYGPTNRGYASLSEDGRLRCTPI